MSIRTTLIASAATLGLILAGGIASADAPMKAPKQVQTSLATLNRVVDHTARLIQAKNYPHLLHENDEFKEGSEALEKSIAKESADFKAKVDPLLKQADADSQSIADAATAKDDGKLATTHEALTNSVKALLAAFPSSVQPPPPKPGAEVKWQTSQGETSGTVVKTVTTTTKVKGHVAKASKDHPEVLVKSSKTGKVAVHKPEALKT